VSFKIGVFAGDFFWSSTPYESLDVYNGLKGHFDCNYIIFEDDIRLNKVFSGDEKYYFETEKYKNADNLKVIKDWQDLSNISKQYDLIMVSTHIAPKTRWPFGKKCLNNFKNNMHCKVLAWDIGGSDMISNAVHYADYFFTKGKAWTGWLERLGKKAYTVGCPQYDYFLDGMEHTFGARIQNHDFYKKYSINRAKETILVLPSNPSSGPHNVQMAQNMACLDFLHSSDRLNILIKCYPNDYLIYEDLTKKPYTSKCSVNLPNKANKVYTNNEQPYTGVYKRPFVTKSSGWVGAQYDYLKKRYPNVKVIDSQDHHTAIICSEKIFNIAGSNVAWETLFTNSVCFSMNYTNKHYYKWSRSLPTFVDLPDEHLNYEISHPIDAFDILSVNKDKCSDFILLEKSVPNMIKALEQIARLK
jgi:hypothetical protein